MEGFTVEQAIRYAVELMDRVPLRGSDSRNRSFAQRKLLEIAEKATEVEKCLSSN